MTPRQKKAHRAALLALIRPIFPGSYEVGDQCANVYTVHTGGDGWRCTCTAFANAKAARPNAPLRERACGHLMLLNDLIVRNMFKEKRK